LIGCLKTLKELLRIVFDLSSAAHPLSGLRRWQKNIRAPRVAKAQPWAEIGQHLRCKPESKRRAGGESLKDASDQFEALDIPRSKWQVRLRTRSSTRSKL
jgi:hypothetical protein